MFINKYINSSWALVFQIPSIKATRYMAMSVLVNRIAIKDQTHAIHPVDTYYDRYRYRVNIYKTLPAAVDKVDLRITVMEILCL